jgi:hypothetical protein
MTCAPPGHDAEMKRWGTAAAGVLAMTLAGCGSDDGGGGTEEGGGVKEQSGEWLTSTVPVTTAPLVWEAEGVVHLSDGTEVDLDGAPSSYVVAGDGVFFAEAEDASQAARSRWVPVVLHGSHVSSTARGVG